MLRWLSREGLLGFTGLNHESRTPKKGVLLAKPLCFFKVPEEGDEAIPCVVRQLGCEEAAKVYIFHIVKSNRQLGAARIGALCSTVGSPQVGYDVLSV